MRLIAIVFSFCVFGGGMVHASCSGQDLSDSLTESEQALFEKRLSETPFPVGNHWRAKRGDDVLHLVGTLHLGDPRLDGPTERLVPLVEGAGKLLLEMTDAEETQLQTALSTQPDMLMLPDQTLPELLPEQDWQQLADAMRDRGMPPFMVARMQPWYVSMLLSIPACLVDQLTEQNGLDARLERAADAAAVPTGALEPFDTGFSAFGDMSFDTQVLMIRSALAAPEASEDLFETVLAAYFAEDHAASQIVLEVLSPRLTPLTNAENDVVFEQVEQALLIKRNEAWIPVIEEALATTDGYVVAAFGAAHLAGQSGILQLLADAGFDLERMPF